jgi:hypothetical protein
VLQRLSRPHQLVRALIKVGELGALLAGGIPVSLLEPVSGGWLLIAIGVLALVASRRDCSTDSGNATTQRKGTSA